MLRFLTDFGRLVKAAWVLSRHDALIPREYAAAVPRPVRAIGAISRIGAKGKGLRAGQRLAKALAGQGPAYVKFGQLLATRPDIVGFEMADDLSALQDKMSPFATELAQRQVEAVIGKPIDEVFTSFSDAIAAASVAQVHRAQTIDGRDVAVKVLRPDIEIKAKKEFRAFMLGAKMVYAFVPRVRRMEPVKFIQTLSDAADVELDLRIEAGASSEISDNLSTDDKVRVPEIFWEYCGRRVLTVEWVDGCNIYDIDALDAQGVDRKELARRVMQSFLTQALDHGFFHADMHQGNMFVDRQGRLVLIDFGITGRLDDKARRVFAEIIYGFIQRDYHMAAKAHFDAGYVSSDYSVDAFATALRSVGEPIFGRDAHRTDMSKVLQQLFDVTDVFDMHLRPELVLLQRTMVVVEGVARIIDPEINLWETAEPVVRSYVSSRVGPKAILGQAKDNTVAALALFEAFPQFAAAAEELAQQVSDGGIALSDETVDKLAAALKKRRKPTKKGQTAA